MQRVQWDAMQHPEIVRELEAGKQEAAKRIQQLMAAAGMPMPGKRGPKPVNALALADELDDIQPEDEAAQ